MLPGVDLNELQMTFQAKREELAKRGVPKWKRELVRAMQPGSMLDPVLYHINMSVFAGRAGMSCNGCTCRVSMLACAGGCKVTLHVVRHSHQTHPYRTMPD